MNPPLTAVLVLVGSIFFGIGISLAKNSEKTSGTIIGTAMVIATIGGGIVLVYMDIAMSPEERLLREEERMLFEDYNSLPQTTVAGKIVNSNSLEWLNDRLVLVYLRDKEIARTTSQIGEYALSAQGVHDGLFVVDIPNTYKLRLRDLRNSESGAVAFLRSEPTKNYYHWFDQFEEGSQVEIPVPSKNIRYTVKVLSGNAADLPRELLTAGSTRLKEDGTIVALSTFGSTDAYSDNGAASAVESLSTGQTTENVILNKLTVPINNCGGSSRVMQRYTQSQTFIHEYVSEFGGSTGVEVGLPWAKLLVELQAKYGFEQGQVDSRTADTTLEVEPGTNQVFIIVWSEVWDSGTATVMAGKDRIEAPFRVKKDVIYSIDSQKLACP